MNGHEHALGRSDGRLTVAIVDDDARVRRALKELVESAPDLEVVSSTGTSHDALRDELEHQPDVVLLDMMLPTVTDGMRVLQLLTSRNRPVIALSVLGSLRQHALDSGAFAFVEKDGREIDVLHDTIRAAAHRD